MLRSVAVALNFCTVLHPKYKTSYFKKTLDYSRTYIEEAKKLVRDEFKTHYARLKPDSDVSSDELNDGVDEGKSDTKSGHKVCLTVDPIRG